MMPHILRNNMEAIYEDTLAFLLEHGYSHDNARIYAKAMLDMYTQTMIRLTELEAKLEDDAS